MRKLVVLGADHYVRNLLTAGAFDELEDDETYYVARASGMRHASSLDALRARRNFLGALPDERPRRAKAYANIQLLLLCALRDRSYTLADKVRLLPWFQRARFKLLARLRGPMQRWYLFRAGRNRPLHALMRDLRPDVVIAPTGGIDHFVTDAIRSARELGITSVVIAHNWDNLSSKGSFPVKPDHLAVWGPQSVEHAERIHGFDRDAVHVLGVPSFDSYFRHEPGSTRSPFDFRYVLFAGCFAPFDEASALERLDRAIEEQGLGVKVVYRPHPHRRPRVRPDRVDEARLRHVVIDPQVREHYEASFDEYRPGVKRAKPLFPALDYYPALLENAELVICPLSTMIVEAAIFERRVIVVAYDDGLHPASPATVVNYDHFQGIDAVDGLELCRTEDDLPRLLADLLRAPAPPSPPLRDSIGWWLYHDDATTYAERLARLVDQTAAPHGAVATLAR